MKGETNNKRQAKLLAAVAVMAMVVCALAVAMPAEEADANTTGATSGSDGSASTTVSGDMSAETFLSKAVEGVITLQGNVNIKSDDTFQQLTVNSALTITSAGNQQYTLTTTKIVANAPLRLDSIVLASSTSTGNNNIGVSFNDVDGALTITDSRIKDFGGKAVYVSRAASVSISGSDFDHNGYATMNEINTYGDYVIDVNLYDSQNATVSIVDNKFTSSGASKGIVKITQRGNSETDDTCADGNPSVSALIKSVTITGNDFSGNDSVADIVLGSSPIRGEQKSDRTYTYAFGSLEIVSKNTTTLRYQALNDADTVYMDLSLSDGAEINGTGTISSEGTKTGVVSLTLEGDAGIDGTIMDNLTLRVVTGTVSIAKDDELNGSIEFGTSATSVTLNRIKAGEGGLNLSKGSIKINGTAVPVDGSTGTITITGDAIVDGDTDLTGVDIVMSNNSTLTIPANMTLVADSIKYAVGVSNGSSVALAGNLELKDTNDGNLTVPMEVVSGALYTGVKPSGDIISYDAQDGQFQFGDTLNSNYTVTASEYLSTNLVIPEGVTLTIAANGNLNMAKCNIYVFGTIAIQGGGSISGTSGSETIYLMRGGEIVNDGTIGYGTAVSVAAGGASSNVPGMTVTYNGSGSVKMQNVSGVEFSLVNVTEDGAETAAYRLAISGDVEAEGMSGTYSAIANGVRINGDVYIGLDVIFEFNSNASTLLGSNTITVDGTMDADSQMLVMANNSTIVVNGTLDGTVKAETGDYESRYTYSDITGSKDTAFGTNITRGTAYITGFTLTVGTYQYQVENADGTFTSWTAQRLYVSGALAFESDATGVTGNIVLGGNVNAVVAEGSVLSLPDDMGISGTIVVEGTVQYTTGTVDSYIGSKYSVTVTTPTRSTTNYIVPFGVAMENIATADRNTVTVKGALEIDSEVTLGTGYTLDLSNATVTIDEDGSLTIAPRATVRGTVNTVEGILTVYGSCAAPTNFNTRATGTDDIGNFTKYCGIIAALNGAASGDTITVVNAITGVKDLEIPAGVTVVSNVDITISGNLKVASEAKLVIGDSAYLTLSGQKSTVTVDGVLDLSEGTVTFSYGTRTNAANSITSTGTTTIGSSNLATLIGQDGTEVNAVMYVNEENYRVLANATAALAAAATQDTNKAVTVYGTVNAQNIDVAVDMTVADGAKANFGSITLADGKRITLVGELTGAVTVQTGVAGSESPSTMNMSKATGIIIEAGSTTDSQNVKTFEMYLSDNTGSALEGSVSVSAGTVTVKNVLTIDAEKNVLTIDAGATMVVGNNSTLNVGNAGAAGKTADAVVVNGTLVADEGTVSVGYNDGANDKPGYMLVAGTFQVADETNGVTIASNSIMTVTGTLDVSTTADRTGSVTVAGVLVVGSKPTTVGAGAGVVNGAVDTNGTTGYIKAYAGADLSGALIDYVMGESNAESTAFVINGWTYMTVYAEGGVDYVDVIGTDSTPEEKFTLAGFLTVVAGTDGYNINTVSDWCIDADLTLPASESSLIGADDAIYFKVNSAMVDVTISVGEGISLYIDGIRYITGTQLAVGTHTVSATVNPGYKGDVTVQFNGQTVTGSFTITPEMASAAYEGTVSVSASGNITQDSTVVVDGGSEDGMGLTDILLIILVVLIVVMAIMVAMRLMRS